MILESIGGNVHARACVGGTIVLAESDLYDMEGRLPSGAASRTAIRVSRPHALVFMKCLAMDDRYRNVRGIRRHEHDRDSARVHVADVVDILTVQPDPVRFRENFVKQFDRDPDLRGRIAQITREYFTRDSSPGLVLYEEFLAGNADLSPEQINRERRRSHRLLAGLLFD